jgi:hypothetical protein
MASCGGTLGNARCADAERALARRAVFDRADVDAILAGLLDIRRELAGIRALLKEDNDDEEEADEA